MGLIQRMKFWQSDSKTEEERLQEDVEKGLDEFDEQTRRTVENLVMEGFTAGERIAERGQDEDDILEWLAFGAILASLINTALLAHVHFIAGA